MRKIDIKGKYICTAINRQKIHKHRIKHYVNNGKVIIYSVRIHQKGYCKGICVTSIIFIKDGNKFKKIGTPLVRVKNWGGLEDPRLFEFKNRSFIIANGVSKKFGSRSMYICDVNSKKWSRLFINGNKFKKIKTQKNWVPYEYNGKLYFIYSLFPMTVVQCMSIRSGKCKLVQGNTFQKPIKFYGSTQLLNYNGKYIGFAHIRHPYYSIPYVYDPVMMKLIYYGDPIDFTIPQECIDIRKKHGGFCGNVQFAYDIRKEGDSVVLSLEFDDRCSTKIYFSDEEIKDIFNII